MAATWPPEAIPIPSQSLVGKVAAISLFAYGGSIKDALLRLKHGHHVSVARPLGRFLGHPLREIASACDTMLIGPVPLHPQRLRDRGFNQALALLQHARAVLPRRARPRLARDLLIRIKTTPPLGHASRAERLRIVQGAFAIGSPGRCRGREVILVDDVLTTGATAIECAKVLVADGAIKVIILTIARSISAFIP